MSQQMGVLIPLAPYQMKSFPTVESFKTHYFKQSHFIICTFETCVSLQVYNVDKYFIVIINSSLINYLMHQMFSSPPCRLFDIRIFILHYRFYIPSIKHVTQLHATPCWLHTATRIDGAWWSLWRFGVKVDSLIPRS